MSFRVSIGVDLDPSKAKSGAAESRQAVQSIGTAAEQTTPKVQQLAVAQAGLHDKAMNDNARAWTGLLASEAMALDNLRARYNPLFATIQAYKTAQVEIKTAHAMGALSTDEMTAALSRHRQATLASIDAIKGRNLALRQQVPATPFSSVPGGMGGAFQTANIAAQFQDIGVTAAMGMNPLMIGLQQGAQLSSVLSTMERPIAGLGAAFAGLLSPLSLATVGLTAAGAAAIQYFASWNSGADSLEADLKTQADLVAELAKQFKGAGEAAQGYARDSAGVLTFRGGANEKDLKKAIKEQADELDAQLRWSTSLFSRGPTGEQALRSTFDSFVSSIQAGSPAVLKFRDDLSALKTSGIHDIDAIIKKWLENTDAMAETQTALNRIQNTVMMADPSMRAIADRWRGRENDPYAMGASTDAVGMLPPSILPQTDPRRSLDYGADELKAATEALQQAQRAASASGLTGLGASIRAISDRYDELIAKTYNAKDAIDIYRQAEALEIETARRRALLQPLQDAARSTSELERAVSLQRATFGLSAGEAGNLTEQMRLYNEYARAGVRITPELARAIAESGARYGAAAGDLDKLTKAQQDAIGRMDGLRSATKSALGAAFEGNWDSVGKSFTDWASGIVTDQLTEGLLGRPGEAGGGLFGNLASSLLGGTARGSSAANPVFVTFGGAGGASGLFGNLTPANSGGLGLIGGTDMMAKYREAIASIESGGRYNALGPLTASGDRAYGRYGVMGSNVGPWTQQALGYSMSPTAFLSSPAAQDAVFNKMFGGLLSRFGNTNDAASAWFTGRPLAQGANATDILGTTGSAYVDKFNAALGTATTGLESFANSTKGASAGSASAGAGYPAPLSLTPAQAAKMPAGVSPYGTGWAEQEVGALSASFSVLNQGVSSIVDQFVPGLGSVLGQLLNGIAGAGSGSAGGGGGLFSWLGSLFGGGGGWGVDNSAAFLPYALGGVPAAKGLHSYANQVVSTPTVFAFAKGAGVMGEAGDPEGIFPLTRDRSGRLGVRASWDGANGGQDGGSNILIQNFGSSQVTHETTRDARGRRQEKFVISDAVGDAMSTPGGGADKTMRQRYGIRTGGIRR